MPPEQLQDQSPQIIDRKVQRNVMASGQLVELQDIETVFMVNGTSVRDHIYQLEPPAADGSLPKDLSEVNECPICLGIFSMANLAQCVVCGRYCSGGDCRVEVPPTPEVQSAIRAGLIKPQPTFMCRTCFEDANMTFLHRLRRAFWRL